MREIERERYEPTNQSGTVIPSLFAHERARENDIRPCDSDGHLHHSDSHRAGQNTKEALHLLGKGDTLEPSLPLLGSVQHSTVVCNRRIQPIQFRSEDHLHSTSARPPAPVCPSYLRYLGRPQPQPSPAPLCPLHSILSPCITFRLLCCWSGWTSCRPTATGRATACGAIWDSVGHRTGCNGVFLLLQLLPSIYLSRPLGKFGTWYEQGCLSAATSY